MVIVVQVPQILWQAMLPLSGSPPNYRRATWNSSVGCKWPVGRMFDPLEFRVTEKDRVGGKAAACIVPGDRFSASQKYLQGRHYSLASSSACLPAAAMTLLRSCVVLTV